ncbi:hypothetical protein DFH09DRAFT_1273201 [Mycena vulgaris]|nr:hypothetical protein DFH09DRAFT_1273201 [Mycena vulgaris]
MVGRNNGRVTGLEAWHWNRAVQYAVSAGHGWAEKPPNIQKISRVLLGHHRSGFSPRCNICADIEPTADESDSAISGVPVAHTVEASVRPRRLGLLAAGWAFLAFLVSNWQQNLMFISQNMYDRGDASNDRSKAILVGD